jgi:hypothetical protein
MNKHLQVGIGGVNCNCCFPAPGSKHRKMLVRKAKRDEAKAAWKAETFEKGAEKG